MTKLQLLVKVNKNKVANREKIEGNIIIGSILITIIYLSLNFIFARLWI